MIPPKSAAAEARARIVADFPDFRRLFESLPGLYLALNTHLCIVGISDDYAQATMTRREEIAGRDVFAIFPDNPEHLIGSGMGGMRASFERVLATGVCELIPVQRYDVRRPEAQGGGFEERHWNAFNSPIRGADGSVQGVMHRVEDVTDLVRLGLRNLEHERFTEMLRKSSQGTHALLREAVAARREAEQAREHSAALARRLQALLEALPVGIAFSDDATCQQVQGNLMLCEQFEIGAGANVSASAPDPEAMGRKVRYFLGGRELGEIDLPLQRAVAANAPVTPVELEIELPGGRRWWAAVSGAPVRDAQGAVIAGVAMIEDITRRKQVEATLRESEERFRQVTGAIEQVFWMTVADKGEMLYISPGYERIWGSSCQSLYDSPRHWLDAIHAEDRPRALDAARTLQVSGQYDLEYRIVRPDGTERWIHDRAFPIHEASGEVRRIAGVADDITRRKHAELALLTSQGKLRTLSRAVEQSPAGVLITNPAGAIEYVNLKFTELTGYSLKEMLGENPRRLQSGRQSPEFYREMWAAITAGHIWRGEFCNRKKNGELFWEFAVIAPIQDDAGVLTHFVALTEDITRRKRREIHQAFLMEMQAIFNPLVSSLEIMRLTTRRIAAHLDLARCGLMEINEAADSFTVLHEDAGDAAAEAGVRGVYRIGEFFSKPARRHMAAGNALVVADAKADERVAAERFEALGVRALANVSYVADGRWRFVLSAMRSQAYEWPAEDLELLVELAERICPRLERARWEERLQESALELGRLVGLLQAQMSERERLEREILAISEREQCRLGQDLHDGLGQELAGIAMLNMVLANKLDATAHPCAADAAKIATYTNGALHSARSIARGLYPVELSRFGLLMALEDLADQVHQRFGIQCELLQKGAAAAVPESAAIHLYRIVQECIGNAIKHGQARRILIEAVSATGRLTFSVTDDGSGFKLPAAGSGMGLHLMNYRARVIGAELHIEKPAEGGCRVSCWLAQ